MDFLTSLRRFISKHDLLPRGATVIVGVSGGADSLGLLHALNTLAPELDLRLHVAHLNHQLRGDEAQADADFVRDIAQQWNLPCTIEARDVAGFARQQQTLPGRSGAASALRLPARSGARPTQRDHRRGAQRRRSGRIGAHALSARQRPVRPARHAAQNADCGIANSELGFRNPHSEFHIDGHLLSATFVGDSPLCHRRVLRAAPSSAARRCDQRRHHLFSQSPAPRTPAAAGNVQPANPIDPAPHGRRHRRRA